MSSVNKVILIGRLGKEPEKFGDKVMKFSLATSETYKDKSGEKKEITDWHSIVVVNSGLFNYIQNYIHKGSMVYVEGKIKNREVVDGDKKNTYTDIVISPYDGEIQLLESKK